MPANLPPQYFEAEKKFREAKTTEEKIKNLKEMIAIMPKHKGTEKLHAILKTKLSKLSHQEEKKAKSRKERMYNIPKEGAGQVVLVGLQNSGKSALFTKLTSAPSAEASYPFSTTTPVIGMMPYEDIRIQVVDLPPFSLDHTRPWQIGIARQSDLILLTIDASDENILENKETMDSLLRKYELKGNLLWVFTKMDEEKAHDNLKVLEDLNLLPSEFYPVSVKKNNLDKLKNAIFKKLRIIRIYTKTPGNKPDFKDPLILKENANVLEAARKLHKDFAKRFKYARLWDGNSCKGQRVPRDHVLKDKNILEFHIG